MARETFMDIFHFVQQAEFLCVGCMEYTIQLAVRGVLRKGTVSYSKKEDEKKNQSSKPCCVELFSSDMLCEYSLFVDR